jgi:hypothetical protein
MGRLYEVYAHPSTVRSRALASDSVAGVAAPGVLGLLGRSQAVRFRLGDGNSGA